MSEAELPRVGDRVRLGGSHRKAGYDALYLEDRQSSFGLRPWVLLDDGTECFVMEPQEQMTLLRRARSLGKGKRWP